MAITPLNSIPALCRNIKTFSGREPILRHLDFPRGRHDTTLYEVTPFFHALGPEKIVHFGNMGSGIAYTNDGRTDYFKLDSTVPLFTTGIKALRLKGICPETFTNRDTGVTVVPAYREGPGFVPNPITIDPTNPNVLLATAQPYPAGYSPTGSMHLPEISLEVQTALRLGPTITDPILGFAIFNALEFEGMAVGYVIYGMPRYNDVRVGSHLLNSYLFGYRGAPQGMVELIEDAGRKLRQANEAGIWLRYPQLDNFAVYSQVECRAVDLDAARELPNTTEARASALYVGLSRTMVHLQKIHPMVNLFLAPLIGPFLRGYFGSTILPSFSIQLEDAIAKTTDFRARTFMIGQKDSRVLTKPRNLLKNDPGVYVNLRDFTSNRLFGLFYESLLDVAAEIRAQE
jgi:hypothetical protein